MRSRRHSRPKNKRSYKDLDFEKRARIRMRVKIWLAAVFVVLIGFDIGLYLATEGVARKTAFGIILIRTLWTAALVIAVGFRQSWARYAFQGLLLISALANIFSVGHIFPAASLGYGLAVGMALASMGTVFLLNTEDFRDYVKFWD